MVPDAGSLQCRAGQHVVGPVRAAMLLLLLLLLLFLFIVSLREAGSASRPMDGLRVGWFGEGRDSRAAWVPDHDWTDDWHLCGGREKTRRGLGVPRQVGRCSVQARLRYRVRIYHFAGPRTHVDAKGGVDRKQT